MAGEAIRPATASEVAAALRSAPLEHIEQLAARYEEDPRRQVQSALSAARKRLAKEQSERDRVEQMYQQMIELGGTGLILGIDEVGRGALAGPLTVCAVALPADPKVWGINDSKQLTPMRREALAEHIRQLALAVGIKHIWPSEIDRHGMARAIHSGMAGAIEEAGVEADAVLIDGNPVHVHPGEKTIVKGDARIACIAAASIVAKVTRDAMMVAYEEDYPGYSFAKSKGYGSSEHIEAIKAHGLSPIHRESFCGNFLETPRLF